MQKICHWTNHWPRFYNVFKALSSKNSDFEKNTIKGFLFTILLRIYFHNRSIKKFFILPLSKIGFDILLLMLNIKYIHQTLWSHLQLFFRCCNFFLLFFKSNSFLLYRLHIRKNLSSQISAINFSPSIIKHNTVLTLKKFMDF